MSEHTNADPEVLTDHTDVICSTSIERIVTGRNAALQQTESLIHQLNDISTLTRSIGGKSALDWAMKQDFRCGCWLMEKPQAAMKAITRNLDRSIWRDLMKKSGMLALMDAQARDEWYNSLEKDDIPAVSEKNILSTFEQLHHSKGEVFERGVINVFKGLSWDFKSNSPCKFGKKIIVTGLVKYDRWGFGLNWGWQHGAFEQLHGFASGQQFADTLCDRVARFHGTAFRAWLAFLTHDQDASTTLARELLRRYQNALMPDNAGNQVQRIVARFALLAAAGEIATLHGITGWQKGTAYEAVQICLHAWLNERGHIANQEDEGVLAQIKRFITAHQYSRFASWDGPDRPLNMAGFRRVEKDPLTGEEHTLFFILPEGWREICRGFSPARAARLCQEAECLQPGSDGKYQSQVRLPEIGKTRVYRLTSRILSI